MKQAVYSVVLAALTSFLVVWAARRWVPSKAPSVVLEQRVRAVERQVSSVTNLAADIVAGASNLVVHTETSGASAPRIPVLTVLHERFWSWGSNWVYSAGGRYHEGEVTVRGFVVRCGPDAVILRGFLNEKVILVNDTSPKESGVGFVSAASDEVDETEETEDMVPGPEFGRGPLPNVTGGVTIPKNSG